MAGDPNDQDHYDVLDINRDSTTEDIKRSYRKKVMECHPDVNPEDCNAEEKFKRVNEAYQTLVDDERRQAYDDDMASYNPQIQFGGLNKNRSSSSYHVERGRCEPLEKERLHHIYIDRSKILIDNTIPLEYEMNVECPECKGAGGIGNRVKCTRCDGWGTVSFTATQLSQSSRSMDCPDCKGKGFVYKIKCTSCNGKGRIKKITHSHIKLPSSFQDGEIINLELNGEKIHARVHLR